MALYVTFGQDQHVGSPGLSLEYEPVPMPAVRCRIPWFDTNRQGVQEKAHGGVCGLLRNILPTTQYFTILHHTRVTTQYFTILHHTLV